MPPLLYLDHNATTPLDPRVLQVLLDSSQLLFGNPSSLHAAGRQSRSALQKARTFLATFLGFRSSEVMFCSGGTEGMNMLLRGWCKQHPEGHVLTSSAEHACVYETLLLLQQEGHQVTFLSPGRHGSVLPSHVESYLQEEKGKRPLLLCFMAVNNETGVKTDVTGMAHLAHHYQTKLVVDGVAWLGKESGKMPLGVTAVCCSAHKIGGPKGIAALAVRGWKVPPLITGGGQKLGARAGTEPVPAIMAFAEAVKGVEADQGEFLPRMMRLRNRFEQALIAQIPGIIRHGTGDRVGNTSSLSFIGCEGESLLIALDQMGIAASHGSACASGALEPSRVLREMGATKEEARSAVRFSLGRNTTLEEIERAIAALCQIVPSLRQRSM